MARSQPWFGSFWDDPHVEAMTSDQKLVFGFLFSWIPASGGISGIYVVTLETISRKTKRPEDEIRTMIVDDGLHNVRYDEEHSTVFVRNKLRYYPGTRPENIARSVVGDYRMTQKAIGLWREFAAVYNRSWPDLPWLDKMMQDDALQAIFKFIESGKAPSSGYTADDILDGLTAEEKAKREGQIDNEIQDLLAAYSSDEVIDGEDADMVYKVYDYVTTSRKTGSPILPERRRKILRQWAKEPPAKIARAAFEFIRSDSMETQKDERYFWGIVKKSATSWYIEFQNAQDKEQFRLEDRT